MNTKLKHLLGLFSLVVLTFFSSCSKEEDDVIPEDVIPTITATQDASYTTSDFEVGEQIVVTANITASEGIQIFQVLQDGVDITTDFDTSILPASADTTYEQAFTFTVAGAAGDTGSIEFRVKDADDTDFTSASYPYTVVAQGLGGGGGVFPLLRTKATVSLGAENASEGSYFASSTGTVFLSGQSEANQSTIDITFGVGASGGASLISPDHRSEVSLNETTAATTTTFSTSTLTSIDAVTSSDIENNISSSDVTSKFVNVSSGSVYTFVNAAGAKGYVKVNSITGSGMARVAEIDVLVQIVQ